MAVYTPKRTKQRRPILLATPYQQDFNTWLSLLNESCCASRELGEHPSKQALWAVTCKGDVLVHEPSPILEAPAQYLPCDHLFWHQVPAHLLCVESNSLGVVWGIGYDHTAWVYTRGRVNIHAATRVPLSYLVWTLQVKYMLIWMLVC
ncbi:tectonin beta-propeller repeat-containing protein 1-like [Carassius carassius]|uniref:tectonin beta-propeller repeat-containing protein 1-like n=1 Tax=Carassius carassius TaxID=217509 RepID=UPI002868639D|nr:tectonin beta-propeller repeat-containing protein 1-like [Carassius carassius]